MTQSRQSLDVTSVGFTPGLDLQGASLANVDLSQANLKGANLSGADLQGRSPDPRCGGRTLAAQTYATPIFAMRICVGPVLLTRSAAVRVSAALFWLGQSSVAWICRRWTFAARICAARRSAMPACIKLIFQTRIFPGQICPGQIWKRRILRGQFCAAPIWSGPRWCVRA